MGTSSISSSLLIKISNKCLNNNKVNNHVNNKIKCLIIISINKINNNNNTINSNKWGTQIKI